MSASMPRLAGFSLSSRVRKAFTLLALAGMAPAAFANGLTFLVGSDAACDYPTIQQAVNAAASVPGPDAIHVARNQIYTAQAIKIGTQDLEIVGGFAHCTAPVADGVTTISGAGGAADSVIEIRGGGVRVLRNLGITGGDEGSNDHGGGIDFLGSGALELVNVAVIGNSAGLGGGISFMHEGSGTATLELKAQTVVFNNTAAHHGGGIYAKGGVQIFMVEEQTTIAGNHAPNGRGGGVYLTGEEGGQLTIRSPGYNALGAISGNEAKDGGGIALVSSGNNYAQGKISALSPTLPTRIESNVATGRGGGVYLQGYSAFDSGSLAYLHADNLVLEMNTAAQGAAVYLASDSNVFGDAIGSDFWLRDGAGGGARCPAGNECSAIRLNRATAADGAIVQAEAASDVRLGGVSLVGNIGGQLLRTAGNASASDRSTLAITDSLLASNTVSGQLIDMHGSRDSLSLSTSTIGGNSIGANEVIGFTASTGILGLYDSILAQPGKLSLKHPAPLTSANLAVGSTLASDTSTLPTGDNMFEGPARFVDPEHGDFHLRAGSPAIDFAAAVPGNPIDLDGRARDQPYDLRPDRLGSRDLGAYEYQPRANFVLNDSFTSDLRLWQVLSPNAVSFSTQSYDSGSGSLEVNAPVSGSPAVIVAARQCIHVPGPALYRLSGLGFAGGGTIFTRDRLSIYWALHASTQSCNGGPMLQGMLDLPSANAWMAPNADASIPVAPAVWNYDTAIEIQLLVERNPNDTAGGSVFGRFDRIWLSADGSLPDELFKDGFE